VLPVAPPVAPDTSPADAEPPAARLDALELQAMDAEVAQAALDAVVIRHGEDITRLQRAIAALARRVDTLASQDGRGERAGGAADGTGFRTDESMAEALERERPPHY